MIVSALTNNHWKQERKKQKTKNQEKASDDCKEAKFAAICSRQYS